MAEANGNTGSTSGFMGIGDLSRFWTKKPPQQSQQPQQAQQSGQPPQGNQQQSGTQSGNVQQSVQNAQQGHGGNGVNNDGSPLAAYAGLWDNAPAKDDKGNPITPPQPPAFTLNPETIAKAAGQVNFLNGIPPELKAKLDSGEPLDGQTVMALIQHAGQQAYSTSMQHASTLTDRFVGMRLTHEQQGLKSQMNKLLAQNRVVSLPEIQKNPALKEHFEIVADRISARDPNLDPETVAQMTLQYFQELGKLVGGSGQQQEGDVNAITYNNKGEMIRGDGSYFDFDAYLKT